MNGDFIKILCILAIVGFLFYVFLATYYKKRIEGMDNSNTVANGIGSNSKDYKNTIAMKNSQLKSSLSISGNRSNYEDIIMILETYLSNKYMETLLSLDLADDKSVESALSKMQLYDNSRISLNNIMKYVDSST